MRDHFSVCSKILKCSPKSTCDVISLLSLGSKRRGTMARLQIPNILITDNFTGGDEPPRYYGFIHDFDYSSIERDQSENDDDLSVDDDDEANDDEATHSNDEVQFLKERTVSQLPCLAFIKTPH